MQKFPENGRAAINAARLYARLEAIPAKVRSGSASGIA
jgi:hypothetical protein